MVDATARAEICATLREVGLGLREDADPIGGVALVIEGDTYPHRDLIKRLGGRWSGARRVWVISGEPGSTTRGLAEQAAPGMHFTGGMAPAPAPRAAMVAPSPWGSKHYHGHRERLRQRFTEAAPEALADYELLELLLFFSVYRRDTKPIAKALLERFGSLGGVLAAEPSRFAECLRPPSAGGPEWQDVRGQDLRFTQVLLKTVQEIRLRAMKEPLQQATPIGSWTALTDYLQAAMAHDPTEQFRILFLDRKNQLIRDERQSRGTVDHTPLYPREVVKRAIELNASAIIMVHNHPSGDPTPSKADIEMTRQVIDALQTVGVTVHDHVIVGKSRHLSFKAQKLI